MSLVHPRNSEAVSMSAYKTVLYWPNNTYAFAWLCQIQKSKTADH